MTPKRIAILGSTGSIGESTLDLVDRFPGRFQVAALAAGRNVERLAGQARRYRPAVVAIGDPSLVPDLEAALGDPSAWGDPAPSALDAGPPLVTGGADGLMACASHETVEVVVAAIVGAAGLPPTYEAVKRGLVVALANKEAMVVAGELLTRTASRTGSVLLPVDSEHNALHQCLRSGERGEVRRLILTASGGPFFGQSLADLEGVTLEQALKHPTWQMGRKITIDSATLMNKGLEVIEAHFLFGMEAGAIDVVVHPQSIVHSMVEFVDGSIICQMSPTDMRHPIQYALTWPGREPSPLPGLDPLALGSLTFHAPDREAFRCLPLAYRALEAGGSMPAVLNAANEVAVQAFLDRKLRFLDIPDVLESVMEQHQPRSVTSLEAVLTADGQARDSARELVDRAAPAARRDSP